MITFRITKVTSGYVVLF